MSEIRRFSYSIKVVHMHMDNFRQYLLKASYNYDKCTKRGRMNASKILNVKID